MKVLVTIPHYFRTSANPSHGSSSADQTFRARCLTKMILSLRRTLGQGCAYIGSPIFPSNARVGLDLTVVVCTSGEYHLLSQVPDSLYQHHPSSMSPPYLGYECHNILRGGLDRFDYFCFMEDDLLIEDPLFFWKLQWFARSFGEEALLQPVRFETSDVGPVYKLYIDGPLTDKSLVASVQDHFDKSLLRGVVLGQHVDFECPDNPHSGCFFLTSTQMKAWVDRPYFLDYSEEFWGPLESAASLGIMRTFKIYKPAQGNAAFFEIRHLHKRYRIG